MAKAYGETSVLVENGIPVIEKHSLARMINLISKYKTRGEREGRNDG